MHGISTARVGHDSEPIPLLPRAVAEMVPLPTGQFGEPVNPSPALSDPPEIKPTDSIIENASLPSPGAHSEPQPLPEPIVAPAPRELPWRVAGIAMIVVGVGLVIVLITSWSVRQSVTELQQNNRVLSEQVRVLRQNDQQLATQITALQQDRSGQLLALQQGDERLFGQIELLRDDHQRLSAQVTSLVLTISANSEAAPAPEGAGDHAY